MALVNDTQLQYFATKFYGKVKANFDAKGSADTAETNAKAYADGLDQAMDTRVDALETTVGNAQSGLVKDVAVLKGDKTTEGSVAYQIAQIVAGADARFDTLKEIADWIVNDTIGATQMANDIAGLKTLVGTIPAEATSKDIVNYIAEYVQAQLTASDLSQYAKATDFNALKDVVGDDTKGLVKGLADVTTKATNNESAIATLNGADTVEGSVAKALKDAKAYADGLAVNYATAEQGNKADAAAAAIGVETNAENGVTATGIYARLESLESVMGTASVKDDHGNVVTPATGVQKQIEDLQASQNEIITEAQIDEMINGLA